MENVIENKSWHYRVLLTGLLIFGLTLPLSKSISSVTIGLLYAYSFAIVAYDKNFRAMALRHVKQPLNISIILFVLIALARSLLSQNLLEGMSYVKQVSNLFTVYFFVAAFINSEVDEKRRIKNAENLLLFFLLGVLLLDIFGLLTYFGLIGHKKYVLPVTPLNMHHIWAGNLNALGIYVAAGLLLFSKNKIIPKSIFGSLFLIIGISSVLLSTSRTAWMGIFVAVTVSIYFLIKDKRIYFIAAASVPVVCASLYLLSDIVHTRINQVFGDFSLFFSGVTSTSTGLRLLMWKASLEIFLSNPLFGVGPGDYKSSISALVSAGRFPDSILKFNQPHNMYLFSLAATGLTGLCSLLFIFYKTLRFAGGLFANNQRNFGFLALALSVHFLTAGMTESLLNIHVLTCSFALISGICIRRSSINKIDQD